MAGADKNGETDGYQDEDKQEETMEIEEIMDEPIDSTKVSRCRNCRILKFGHPRPFGERECKLSRIDNDEELRQDDIIKNEMRKESRSKKRKLSEQAQREIQKNREHLPMHLMRMLIN